MTSTIKTHIILGSKNIHLLSDVFGDDWGETYEYIEMPENGIFIDEQFKFVDVFCKNINQNTIIVTNSPYIYNYFILCMKRYLLRDLLPTDTAMINPVNLYVWELNETTGKLEQLPKSENGLIATDNDCLNLKLYEINEMYGELLELQQKRKNNGR